jgi:hypothetical protein
LTLVIPRGLLVEVGPAGAVDIAQLDSRRVVCVVSVISGRTVKDKPHVKSPATRSGTGEAVGILRLETSSKLAYCSVTMGGGFAIGAGATIVPVLLKMGTMAPPFPIGSDATIE